MTEFVVNITQLEFNWQGTTPFRLSIPELQIAKGERIFLHGASGSGKSTLLSLVGGVNLPQQGELIISGQNLGRLSAAKRDRFRADHLGFIFQQFNLVPYLSVLENVLLPCRFSALRRQAILQRGSKPETYALDLLRRLEIPSEWHRQSVSHLSVGQQQRVAAARALIGNPSLIMADEPTSALDHDRQRGFLELLLEQCKEHDTTLLFVSHDHDFAPYFNRSLSMLDFRSVVN